MTPYLAATLAVTVAAITTPGSAAAEAFLLGCEDIHPAPRARPVPPALQTRAGWLSTALLEWPLGQVSHPAQDTCLPFPPPPLPPARFPPAKTGWLCISAVVSSAAARSSSRSVASALVCGCAASHKGCTALTHSIDAQHRKHSMKCKAWTAQQLCEAFGEPSISHCGVVRSPAARSRTTPPPAVRPPPPTPQPCIAQRLLLNATGLCSNINTKGVRQSRFAPLTPGLRH